MMTLSTGSRPTVGSLFAGIGGFELAFSRAGFTPSWSVEIDKDCRTVLRRHFPDSALFDDVQTVGAHNLTPVDVITFGSPCQDLSVAGRRAGLDGKRSGLFFEAIRIVAELKPAFAVFENVPGALSSNDGRDFGIILMAFRELGARDIAWRVLDAQHFGVPQRRRRIFLVADFTGEHAAEVLFESESMSGNPASGREAGAGIAASTGERLAASGAVGPLLGGHRIGADEAAGGQLVVHPRESSDAAFTASMMNVDENTASGGYLHVGATAGSDTTRCGKGPNTTLDDGAIVAVTNRGIAGDSHETLRAESHGAIPMVAHPLTSEGADASEDGTGRGTPLVAFDSKASQNFSLSVDCSLTLKSTSTGNGGVPPAIAARSYGVRRLTPLECERLQGFPDGWTEGISDSGRYRMLGNSIAVPCVQWIAERVYAQIESN